MNYSHRLTQRSSRIAVSRGNYATLLAAQWKKIFVIALLLGCISLIFNLSFQQEVEGHWEVYSGFRKTGAKLVSSGSLWAILSFYSGSRAYNAWAGAFAGVVCAECGLAIHYLLGILSNVYESAILASNIQWFIAGVMLCCPLGYLGWLSTHRGPLPLLARFTPAICAICEPIITRRLSMPPPEIPWSERYSHLSSGFLLFIGGLLWAGLLVYEAVTGDAVFSKHPHRNRQGRHVSTLRFSHRG